MEHNSTPIVEKDFEHLTIHEKLEELEDRARVLDPREEDFENLSQEVHNFGVNFINSIDQTKAHIEKDFKENPEFSQEELKIGEKESSLNEILGTFRTLFLQCGTLQPSPGFMAYFSGGGMQTGALGDYLASLVNPFSGMKASSPGSFAIERELIEWSADVFGYPKNCGGNFTTGGSNSNLSAIISARDSQNIKARDYEKCVVYVTDQTHICNQKAIYVAGMRECKIRIINVDRNFRMDCQELEQQIIEDKKNDLKPFMVIGSAGSTNTGAIDPLQTIGEICQKNNLWFHVDGAYGGFFMLCAEGRRKLQGIELSDSIALDLHKTLYMPFGLGLVLVKKLNNLLKPFKQFDLDEEQSGDNQQLQSSYLNDSLRDANDYPDPCELSNELSRNFRSFKLWMCLKLHGVDSFRANLEEKLLLTKYFREEVQKIENIVIVCESDLSVVCYRYEVQGKSKEELNKLNLEINSKIQQDGRVHTSSTVLNNQITLRVAILAFKNHKKQLDTLLEILKKEINLLK